MEITVTVDGSASELQSLRSWLVAEEDLRGRVAVGDSRPVPGTLGAVADVLTVVLAPGGVAAAFAGALVGYIRHRTVDLTYKVTRIDGSEVEISARRVRGLDAEGVRRFTADLARSVEAGRSSGDPG